MSLASQPFANRREPRSEAALGSDMARSGAGIGVVRLAESLSAPVARLPAVLTVDEFGFLVRYDPQVVRRYIRQRRIKAHGRPARIPCQELRKYDIDLAYAAILLAERSMKPVATPLAAQARQRSAA
jgi:hypothetical protein